MKPQSRLPGLDTLRSLAIVSVVIFHLAPFLPPSLSVVQRFGWIGVDLFFVLSGFLIGTQLLKPHAQGRPLGQSSILDFYRRRAFRILPAYLTVVALYLFVPLWREQPHLPAAWKLLTFTSNLFMHYPAELAFSHAWSLCIEEHFYLILPLAVLALTRRPSLRKTLAAFTVLLLAGICLRWWELSHIVRAASDDDLWPVFMKRIYYPTYTRLDGLLSGVALATLRLFRPQWWSRLESRGTATFLTGTLLVLAAMATLGFDYPSPDRTLGVLLAFPLLSLGFTLWVASALATNGPLKLRIPATEQLATLAFSLYLTHKAVAHVARQSIPWLTNNRTWPAAALTAILCLIAATLLYRMVEVPFLHLRDRNQALTTSPAAEPQTDPAI
ncbi:acyltransferase family protein [Granulicella tundricola]|uniref:acyltransferase family protein n=1 Tax=Granulicella tundricola TaxID=940615 RepID=UPI0002FFF4B7|nr:acyltransferase [Granulicella tundricola]